MSQLVEPAPKPWERLTASADVLLERLAETSRQLESYRTAIYHLEVERLELQMRLRATSWSPPGAEAAP